LALWLPDWDTLDDPARAELDVHVASCPVCAPKWALIRRADRHLEGLLRAGAGEGADGSADLCPSAEELFDLGRGPGARRLSDIERVGLSAHVKACAACAEIVATLEARPPAPLLYGGEAATPSIARERRNRWRVWVPLAAAAAVLAIFVWNSDGPAVSPRVDGGATPNIRFPSAQLVRGDASSALLFPRERVLAGPRGLYSKLEFELAPRERAAIYRVQLSRHDGQLFSTPTTFLTVEGPGERLTTGDTNQLRLAPGHYTWEGWAVVDGLDVPLGRRDFEVVRDDAILDEIAQRAAASEPARSESILHLLHDAGFVTDARAFARTLPATPERDAYLARRPAR